MGEKGRHILAVVLVLTILYSFSLSIWTYTHLSEITKEPLFTAKATSGQIELCINTPPTINTSSCSSFAEQDELYSCQINGSDPDIGSSVTLVANPITIDRPYSNLSIMPFNMTLGGNITFTPTNEDVGAYNLTITANDLLDCGNSITQTTFYLEVNNTNDPPYLFQNISNYGFNAGETLYAFFLLNHFVDPDDDPMTFAVSATNNIIIDILPDSQVVLSATNCIGTEYVIFTAIDSSNLTADSNLVAIQCVNTSAAQTPTTGSGGDSGGSGGSSLLCRPDFECYEYHK